MTTKVTVEVPKGANYDVAIKTNAPPARGHTITWLKAGERTEIYIHDGLRIVGIETITLGAWSKLIATAKETEAAS